MRIRNFLRKQASHFAVLALVVGTISTSAICRFVLHQPEVPQKMKDLLEKKNN